MFVLKTKRQKNRKPGPEQRKTDQVVFSKDIDDDNVYVVSRSADGSWTQPARLPVQIAQGENSPSVEANGAEAFIIRIGSTDTKQWLLKPE
jgi:hypothetical protein